MGFAVEPVNYPIDKAILAVAQRNQKLTRARTSFTDFVEAVARDEKGKPFKLAPHHLAWHRHVDYCWSRGLHAGIMAHWGSGKSTGLVAPIIGFLLGKNPNTRLKVVCNSDEQAADRVAVAARMILSPTYKRVFPNVFPGGQWTHHKLFVNRPGWSQEPSVDAKGVTSIGVGGRADVIVLDDTVDQKNSREPASRKNIRDLIFDTWLSRLEPTGLALAIGTRWYLDDAWQVLQQQAGWCWLIQAISMDLTCITQELVGAGNFSDYPGAIL